MIRLIQGMVVGAILAIAVVAVALVKWNSSGDDVRTAEVDSALQESAQASSLQQEWSRIQAEYKADDVAVGSESNPNIVAKQASVAAVAAQSDTTVTTKPDRAVMLTPLDTPEPGQSRADKVLAKLETQFAEEAVDDAWSAQSGDRISSYFSETAGNMEWSGSTLGDVQCHSSLCRVEVVHENEQALQEFSLKFPMQMAQAMPRITYQTEPRNDGRLAMVMYLSR